jgi:hypothetical protein
METNKTEITLREVYDVLMAMKVEMSSHPREIKDHEKRIRDLEFRVYTAAGMFSVIAIIFNQLISYLMKG